MNAPVSHPPKLEVDPALLEGATPFMAQYLTAKASQPDAILFFRMGDFYELFFRDAEVAAGALSVAALLEKKSDSAAVRAAFASADGYDPALWSTLVDQIGAAALSVPEDFDGIAEHRSTVTNALRLLTLPEPVLRALDAIETGPWGRAAEIYDTHLKGLAP